MELDGAQYLGFNLPFSISQLVWIEAILVGGAEIYRNRELEPQARIYPGMHISLCAIGVPGLATLLAVSLLKNQKALGPNERGSVIMLY